ncbi:MAG: oligosaccharide flippase family protein [Candidatus Omnitrophica bacterium]|nr:oligosaccharide flippase family protein [Candidatus Omnitrophota bacterium]
MPEDSLKKRYFYKLSVTLAGYAMGLITMGIIPRGLGPKAFGDFNFITNFFSQIVSFLDMGSSTAFLTKLSQRQEEKGIFVFYLYFALVITAFVMFFVIISRLFSLHMKFWPGQSMFFVYCGVIWAIMNWLANVLNQATDAYGLTVAAEMKKLYQKLFSVIVIVVLFYLNLINLKTFFLYQYFIQIFLVASFLVVLRDAGKLPSQWNLSIQARNFYVKEFVQYCHPLFFYSLVSLLTGIFDRWILQYFGGSVQQGFYGLGFQICSLCMLFTSSLTPLFIREFAIAYARNDRDRMAFLFRRYIPLFYVITAYFSCFAATNADRVIMILAGPQYQFALIPVILMCLFPIHSTYGQLSNSVFLATDQTKLYRNIGVPFMIFGVPLTYIFIAPHHKFGLEMGATGLAIKMLLFQFLHVNICLYFNARYLKISFFRYLVHQILSVLVIGIIAIFSRFAMEKIIPGFHFIVKLVFNGILYSGILAFLAYFYPRIFGLKQDDIGMIYTIVRRGLDKTK